MWVDYKFPLVRHTDRGTIVTVVVYQGDYDGVSGRSRYHRRRRHRTFTLTFPQIHVTDAALDAAVRAALHPGEVVAPEQFSVSDAR